MSRKSKNIIAVIIMFVLIISIILTICLGKEKRSNNYGNFPVQENRPTIKERELPSFISNYMNITNDHDYDDDSICTDYNIKKVFERRSK